MPRLFTSPVIDSDVYFGRRVYLPDDCGKISITGSKNDAGRNSHLRNLDHREFSFLFYCTFLFRKTAKLHPKYCQLKIRFRFSLSAVKNNSNSRRDAHAANAMSLIINTLFFSIAYNAKHVCTIADQAIRRSFIRMRLCRTTKCLFMNFEPTFICIKQNEKLFFFLSNITKPKLFFTWKKKNYKNDRGSHPGGWKTAKKNTG